jgi:hypothetical protein
MAQRMAEMQRQIEEMESEIQRLKESDSGKRQKIHERSK